MPEVERDIENVRKGIELFGARESEIIERENLDFEAFSQLLNTIKGAISANWFSGNKKTLVFVYYAGHGVMRNFTYAVCNSATKSARVQYPLEKQLRTIGYIDGAYVIGIFDCCREEFTPAMRG